jgi:hypothetical protein
MFGKKRRKKRIIGDPARFTALHAMLKAGLKRKPKLKPVAYAKRLATELAVQQRRYCDAFNLWRSCARKSCRRLRGCGGDPAACLARGIDVAPREFQIQARATILAATPHNIGAPEREARQRTPRDCYEE